MHQTHAERNEVLSLLQKQQADGQHQQAQHQQQKRQSHRHLDTTATNGTKEDQGEQEEEEKALEQEIRKEEKAVQTLLTDMFKFVDNRKLSAFFFVFCYTFCFSFFSGTVCSFPLVYVSLVTNTLVCLQQIFLGTTQHKMTTRKKRQERRSEEKSWGKEKAVELSMDLLKSLVLPALTKHSKKWSP